jgi:hypothetical protein
LQEDSNRVCASLEDELAARRQRQQDEAAHSAAALQSAREAAESAQAALAASRARCADESAARATAERQVAELQQLVRQMEGGRERTEAAVWELQVTSGGREIEMSTEDHRFLLEETERKMFLLQGRFSLLFDSGTALQVLIRGLDS